MPRIIRVDEVQLGARGCLQRWDACRQEARGGVLPRSYSVTLKDDLAG